MASKITEVGTAQTSSSTTATTQTTTNVPGSGGTNQTDDLLVWAIVGQTNGLPSGPPSGWQMGPGQSTTGVYIQVFYRWVDGTEGSSQSTGAIMPSARLVAQMRCWRNVDKTAWQDMVASLTNGTTATNFGAWAPNSGGGLVLALGAQQTATGVTMGTVSSGNLSGLQSVSINAGGGANVALGTGYAFPTAAFTPAMANSAATARTIGVTMAMRVKTRTRLYLSNDTVHTPPVSPSFEASWEDTASAARRTMRAERVDSPLGSVTINKIPASVPLDLLHRQFISEPFSGSGTLAGVLSYVFRVAETNAASDVYTQIVVKLVDATGAVQSVLFSGHTATTVSATNGDANQEYSTTASTRVAYNVALTSQSYSAGWYLVVEVGVRYVTTSASNQGAAINHGDPNDTTADFALVPALTTTLVPWIEFDSALAFTSTNELRVGREAVDVLLVPDPELRVGREAVDVLYRKQPDHVGWGQRI